MGACRILTVTVTVALFCFCRILIFSLSGCSVSRDYPHSFMWKCEICVFPKGLAQLPPHPSQPASVHWVPTLFFSTLRRLLGESLAYVRRCLSLLKWPKSRTWINTRCWRRHGPTSTVIHCWWGEKMVQVPRKITGWFLTKLDKFLLYNLATLFLIIYPKGVESPPTQKSACGCLFSRYNGQKWKQPRCPSLDEPWCTQTMGVIQCCKQTSFPARRGHGGHVGACDGVKEASLKRRHAAWFLLPDSLQKAKWWRDKKASGFQALGRVQWGRGEETGAQRTFAFLVP